MLVFDTYKYYTSSFYARIRMHESMKQVVNVLLIAFA